MYYISLTLSCMCVCVRVRARVISGVREGETGLAFTSRLVMTEPLCFSLCIQHCSVIVFR